MLFIMATSRAGEVFIVQSVNCNQTGKDKVIVFKKSTNTNTRYAPTTTYEAMYEPTYEVSRRWGHERFDCIDGIVILEGDDLHEVVCVSDRTCVQTFRPDGSLLRVFGIKPIAPFRSLIVTAFRHLYVLNSHVDKIAVFDLDGALLFQIDVPDISVQDMAVLGDELFVLGKPSDGAPFSRHELHLCVYSVHDGTLLRTGATDATPSFTFMRASPSEGLWFLDSPPNTTNTTTIQCMKPDFTVLNSRKPQFYVDIRRGVVWDRGQAIGVSYDEDLVPLDFPPRSLFTPFTAFKKRKTPTDTLTLIDRN